MKLDEKTTLHTSSYVLLSYFCLHDAHAVCQDDWHIAKYFHDRLGTSLCECECHER